MAFLELILQKMMMIICGISGIVLTYLPTIYHLVYQKINNFLLFFNIYFSILLSNIKLILPKFAIVTL